MAGRWAPDEVQKLKELAERGWTTSRIARALGRSRGSVDVKRRALGLPRSTNPFDESNWGDKQYSRRGGLKRGDGGA